MKYLGEVRVGEREVEGCRGLVVFARGEQGLGETETGEGRERACFVDEVLEVFLGVGDGAIVARCDRGLVAGSRGRGLGSGRRRGLGCWRRCVRWRCSGGG